MLPSILPQATLPLTYRIPLTSFQPGKKGKEREEHLKFSTNKIYAGTHWGKRKSIKDVIARHAEIFCRPAARIVSYPVEIRYRFCFVTRPLDTTNTTALVKMFEDALRAIGILEDDDPSHVVRTIIEVVALRKPKRPKTDVALGASKNESFEDSVVIHISSTDYIQPDI